MLAVVIVLVVVLGLIVLMALMMLGIYNGLIRSRVRTREAWSGIDVQLKRRADLVPNLVETVRGYASHERETFENVTRARAMLQQAGGPAQAAAANNQLTQALRSLFAVAEAYPQLRASENFMALQNELTDIEEKIAYARQFYNRNVTDFNTRIQVFPNVIMANMFNFQPFEFFEAEEGAREAPRVSFTQPPAAPPPAGPPPAGPPPAAPPAAGPPPAGQPPTST